MKLLSLVNRFHQPSLTFSLFGREGQRGGRKKRRNKKGVSLLLILTVLSFVLPGFFLNAQQGKIAYTSNQMGSEDVWIMNADGSDKTRLTFDDTLYEGAPHFSPDGKKIVFTQYDGNEANLMIMNSDGTDLTQIRKYPGAFSLYDWSKTNWICIAVNSNPGCFTDDLRILRPDGSDERVLLQNIPSHGAAVTPDGQYVLYVKSVYCWTPYNEFRIIGIDGTNDRVIYPNDGIAEFWPSYFNMNANQILFHQSDNSSGYGIPLNLYTMNDDGTEKSRITNLVGDHSFMFAIMSDDDSKILCTYRYGNNMDIVMMDRDGGNLINLTNSPYKELLADWYEPTCSFGPSDQFLVFKRKKGKPILKNVEWESCGGVGKMKIKSERVASAYAYLNGTKIVCPQMLNSKTKLIEVPIILEKGSNILQVKIESKPTGKLEIGFMED